MNRWFLIAGILFLITSTSFALTGSGTEAAPYLIQSLADFNEFAGDPNYWDDYTRLETDIDLVGIPYTTAVIAPDTDNAEQYFQGTHFTGIFDGNGHVINNLTINTAGAGNDYLGLFGQIESSGAEIKNLGLENVNVTGGDGSWYVGGLCGFNSRGAIINCHSSGSVTGGIGSYGLGGLCGFNYYGTITNCYTTGSVNGNQNFGGLCGRNYYGTITNCFSSSTVTGRSSFGGLCGENRGIITNCYAVGAVTSGVNPGYHLGGLSGENYGTISNCHATGAVTGGDNSDHLGGLCGENYGVITNCYATGAVTGGDNSQYLGGLCAYNYGTITNCYAVGSVTGGADSWSLGGLCGRNFRTITNCYFLDPTDGGGPDNGQGTPLTDALMKQQANFIHWDFADETANGTSQIWQMPTESGYPVLSSFNGYIPVALSGDGSEDNPYLIGNAAELGAIFHYNSNACFKLGGDIDLTGINWATAVVPAFGGCFDGNGHVIHNLNIEGGGYLGLFGRINGSSAEVKNLGLENGNITGAYNSYYLGGLCGINSEGTITNCYLTGSVTSGGDSRHLGGLCGQNLGTITNCYSAGSVNGWDDLGGLCGRNLGTLINCYSNGSVTGGDYSGPLGGLCGGNYGTISNCYSTGSVTGGDNSENLGGLCGWNSDGAIGNCFWDTQTSGMAIGYNLDSTNPGTITNVAGKTTNQMQTQSTFTGWDFDKPIWMISGRDYPRLIWNDPDIDDSGRVDIADFAIIAQHWQEIDCGFCNYSDLTGDRNINVYDLIVLANSWLYGAGISDHVAAVELHTGWGYGFPDNASDTGYAFEIQVVTNHKVVKIEFLTPSGNLFEIPKKPYNETILPAGYIITEWGYDEQASMDTGEDRYEWFYEAYFNNASSLDDYGDGWYTFTVYFGSGRTQQTDVFFGNSATGQPLPQPTHEPVPLVPAHGANVTSELTFQWQTCTDPNASFIHIYAEHEDLDEEVESDELLEKDVTSWGPVNLSEGPWVGGIIFAALDFTTNADGIDVIAIKYSNVEFEFTVVP